MNIVPLQETPQFKEQVVEWLNKEFGNESSKRFYQGIIEHSLEKDKLPITFVAVEEGELLGTVGIWRGDLLSRQELFPWMSALVVSPDYRNKGIGRELQKHAVAYCKARGYQEVYLYTDLIGYYEKSGWIAFDNGYEYSGNEVMIYRYKL